MPPVKVHAKASRTNGASVYAAEIEKLKRENSMIKNYKERIEAELSAVVVTIFLSIIFAGRRQKVAETVRLKTETDLNVKENEVIRLQKELKKREQKEEKLLMQEKTSKNEHRKQVRALRRTVEKLDESERRVEQLKLETPTQGVKLIPFDAIKDQKTKTERCRRALTAIGRIVGGNNVDEFLHFFFQFVNDSSDFSTRFQLNDEESFFAKVRWGLSDSLLKAFQQYYKRLTGFDVFASRHALTLMQKRMSVNEQYEIGVEEVPRRTLAGNIMMIKHPWAQVKSLESILAVRLSRLARYKRIRFDGATGEKICLAIGGDKGADITKLMLIIQNVDSPNSSHGQILLGFYTGDDNHETLKKKFKRIFDEYNKLDSISYDDGSGQLRTFGIRRQAVGDCKFLSALLGHRGQSSTQPCFLCKITYTTHGSRKATLENTEFDKIHGMRKLEDFIGDGDPLVIVEPDNIIFPPLHSIQGVTQSYAIDYFIAEANRADCDGHAVPETLEEQMRMLSTVESEEQMYVTRISALCDARKTLQEVEKALKRTEKKTIALTVKLCSSRHCIANAVRINIDNIHEMYQCEGCAGSFHMICNGIVTLDERSKASLIGNQLECFECSFDDPLTSSQRRRKINQKFEELGKALGEDQETWGVVNDEKIRLEEVIKKAIGPKRAEFHQVMRDLGCENYACSKNLTGNMTRRFLRVENIDRVVSIFAKTDRMEHIRQFLHHMCFLMSSTDNSLKTDDEIDEIGERIALIARHLKAAHPKKGVTVKLHLICSHAVPHLRANRTWGRVSEQGVEHVHAVTNAVLRRLAPMRDSLTKGACIVQHFSNLNLLFDMGEYGQ